MAAAEQLTVMLDRRGPVPLREVEAVARAFLSEEGEYPANFPYLALTAVVDDDEAGELLDRLRSEHFKGNPPPFKASENSQ